MKAYEVLYIIENTVGDEKREEIINKVKALVENNIGHVRVLSSTEPEINYINYGDISIKESFDKCFDLLKELE